MWSCCLFSFPTDSSDYSISIVYFPVSRRKAFILRLKTLDDKFLIFCVQIQNRPVSVRNRVLSAFLSLFGL